MGARAARRLAAVLRRLPRADPAPAVGRDLRSAGRARPAPATASCWRSACCRSSRWSPGCTGSARRRSAGSSASSRRCSCSAGWTSRSSPRAATSTSRTSRSSCGRRRSRRSAPSAAAIVWVLLTLAGLLRPEAWLLAGVYGLWMVWGKPLREWVRVGAIIAIAPVLWALIGLRRHGRPDVLAELHDRVLAPARAPPVARRAARRDAALPLRAHEAAGLHRRRSPGSCSRGAWRAARLLVPATLLVWGLGTFLLVSLRGFSVINRYVIVGRARAHALRRVRDRRLQPPAARAPRDPRRGRSARRRSSSAASCSRSRLQPRVRQPRAEAARQRAPGPDGGAGLARA